MRLGIGINGLGGGEKGRVREGNGEGERGNEDSGQTYSMSFYETNTLTL